MKKSLNDQRQHILDWFATNERSPGVFTYTVSGELVCWKAWILCNGITERRFRDLKRKFSQGLRLGIHGGCGQLRASPGTENAINFLEDYIKDLGDIMPNSSSVNLPSCLTKSTIYEEMVLKMKKLKRECVSETIFRRIWKEKFPHVTIPMV